MTKLTTTTVDPHALPQADRSALVDELHVINNRIFHPIDRDTFERYLCGPQALRCRIQVVRAAGAAVGYTAVQLYRCEPSEPDVGGARELLVLRSLAGMLPAYRRRTLFGGFLAYEATRAHLLHPSTPLYGFACPVHPSTYRMLARYAVDVWPHPQRRTPAAIASLMTRLAGHFGMQPEPDRPMVCEVGWCTRQDGREHRAWRDSDNPAARFFVEQNPRYQEGYGLMVLVPFKLGRMPAALASLLGKRVRQATAAWWPSEPRRAA